MKGFWFIVAASGLPDGITVVRAVIPGLDAGEQFVGQIVLELQFAAHVGVHRGGERPDTAASEGSKSGLGDAGSSSRPVMRAS